MKLPDPTMFNDQDCFAIMDVVNRKIGFSKKSMDKRYVSIKVPLSYPGFKLFNGKTFLGVKESTALKVQKAYSDLGYVVHFRWSGSINGEPSTDRMLLEYDRGDAYLQK
jgi:hypothetical protein